MFKTAREPLALLVEVSPRLAKRRFREEIYNAWDHECGYCGKPATSLDHIIPKYKSGSSNRNNLIPCCRTCNANKASSSMEEWYRNQEFFSQTKLDAIKEWTKGDKIEFTSETTQFRLGVA